MGACEICGKNLLTRSCNLCGTTVCSGHTLPENHNCPALKGGNRLGQDMKQTKIGDSRSPEPMDPDGIATLSRTPDIEYDSSPGLNPDGSLNPEETTSIPSEDTLKRERTHYRLAAFLATILVYNLVRKVNVQTYRREQRPRRPEPRRGRRGVHADTRPASKRDGAPDADTPNATDADAVAHADCHPRRRRKCDGHSRHPSCPHSRDGPLGVKLAGSVFSPPA
jgi:hypothetical protein